MAAYTMTKAEREAFLAMPWVAVISVAEPDRGPLVAPVWYLYEPGGDILIWTSPETRKTRLLQSAGRMTVCVQDPSPPYRYVTVEGPVSFEPVDYERDVQPMAHRYLGAVQGDRYLEKIGGKEAASKDLLLHLHPEHWLTVDYSKG